MLTFSRFGESVKTYLAFENLRYEQSFPFSRVNIKFDSTLNSISYDEEEGGSYFRKVASFIDEGRGKNSPAENILIIKGPLGSGKSTLLRHIISHHKKNGKAKYLYLDFNNTMPDEPFGLDKDSSSDDFWNWVATKFQARQESFDSIENEIRDLWCWLCSRPSCRAQLPKINRLLTNYEHQLKKFWEHQGDSIWATYEKLSAMLIGKFHDVMKEVTAKEFCYYQCFKFAYLNYSKAPNNIVLFVYDNVDHLTASQQESVVNLAIMLTSLFGWKTIVSVRPYTWSNQSATRLVDVWEHRAPYIIDVICKRLDASKQSNNTDDHFIKAVELFKDYVKSERSPFHILIRGTSGLNIRLSLANMQNFFLSTALRTRDITEGLPKMAKVSEIARAYLFGGTDKFYDLNFDNMYSVNGHVDSANALMKIRILDYILRINKGRITLDMLWDWCSWFEYPLYKVEQILNEWLPKKRALIWYQDGYFITGFAEKEDKMRRSHVYGAPLATSYSNIILGEYFYIEACLAKDATEVIHIDQVHDFVRSLTSQDVEEARAMVKKAGAIRYKSMYSGDTIAVTLPIWKKFLEGLSQRLNNDPSTSGKEMMVDWKREEWMIKNINKALLPEFMND